MVLLIPGDLQVRNKVSKKTLVKETLKLLVFSAENFLNIGSEAAV